MNETLRFVSLRDRWRARGAVATATQGDTACRIDQLVYELYGLTEEEIRSVLHDRDLDTSFMEYRDASRIVLSIISLLLQQF
jgi:hypothetical protein